MPTRNLQKGAVAPLVAVLLLVIMVCIAFVIDLGHIHNVKVELQRAVDAAALAAARQLPNASNVDTVARAVAATNTVDNAPVPVDTDHLQVELGLWRTDTASLGLPVSDGTDDCTTPTDRWNSQLREDLCGSPPNAVLVRATRDVQHAFFFFTDDTEVVADAIALAQPINPVLPLAIVSCIPIDRIQSNPGMLPGIGICDLNYYRFTSDPDDNAAWTSLTLPGGAANIREIIEDPEQRNIFEQIVFGHNLANDGIENTAPRSGTLALPPTGCDHPMGTNINCGLGMINGKELAAPNEFVGPTGPSFPSPAVSITPGADAPVDSSFDPLFDYVADYHTPPRWYNFTSGDGFKTDDHFLRLWSQDGILLMGADEDEYNQTSFNNFQDRLRSYYDTTHPNHVKPFGDMRFVKSSQGGYDFIIGPDTAPPYNLTQQMKQAIAGRYSGVSAADVRYWPNFLKIMIHAGYPQVGVTNGTITDLLDGFFSLPEVADGSNLMCSDNVPLDSGTNSMYGGETLRIQAPVIFGGFCEQFQALSNGNPNHVLVYVGLSDFLMTRAWKNNSEAYACPGPDYVSVAGCPNPFYPPDGGGMDYPPIPSGGNLSLANDNIKGIEGLFKVPHVDETEASSTVKVLLVE